jgi:hypothetical protein
VSSNSHGVWKSQLKISDEVGVPDDTERPVIVPRFTAVEALVVALSNAKSIFTPCVKEPESVESVNVSDAGELSPDERVKLIDSGFDRSIKSIDPGVITTGAATAAEPKSRRLPAMKSGALDNLASMCSLLQLRVYTQLEPPNGSAFSGQQQR